MLITLLIVLILLILLYKWLYEKISKHIPENYPNEKNRNLIDENRKTLVCFGDSNTHGNVSYNWVDDIRILIPEIQVFNAGKNSDLTFTLLNRIEEVIKCNPNFITILIGTNDVNSTMNIDMEKRYKKLNKIGITDYPNSENFKSNLDSIISILKNKTNAKIGIMSLPVIGEDLQHEANLKAEKYSNYIEELALKYEINYLPIREKQIEVLKNNPQKLKFGFDDTYKLLTISVMKHYVLNQSWDEITKKNGFQLSPDNLHQNSVGGGIIRDSVLEFIKNK